MKKFNLKEFIKSKRCKIVVTYIITFLVMYGILITAVTPKKYAFKEGDIAQENIKAPRDVDDLVTTNILKEKQAKNVEDKYANKTDEVKEENITAISNLFSKVIAINRETIEGTNEIINNNDELTEDEKKKLEDERRNKEFQAKLSKLKEEFPVNLSNEDFETFLKLNPKESIELKDFLTEKMSLLYDEVSINEKKFNGFVDIKVIDKIKAEDLSNAQNYIEMQFNKSQFSKNVKELGKNIGYSQIRPNMVYDALGTEKLKEEAQNNVTTIVIKKDQIIVKDGEPVTEAQIEVLRSLGLYEESNSFKFYVYISLAILVVIVIVIQWLYLYKYHKEILDNPKKLILINLVNCISLFLARILSIISPYVIPLACAPMLLTLLIDDSAAITISLINCIVISTVVQFNIPITILAVLNCVVGVVMLKNMEQRNDILYSSLFIAIINALLALTLAFLQLNNDFVDVINKCATVFLGSVLSGILTIGFLPFFESIFDIVTTVKLLELSNPNHPLLKKLLIESPGTYHHSVLVANLSELGAQAIGANSVLARVGAYYHDVGKLKRPYFFKENQMGRENPHDKITPNLSTLIIISHVKDGIELAKEYKVPKVIRDIIQQHHGTSLVKYFYIRMKNTSEKPEEVKEEDFKYIGPAPLSKEAGIVMLADGVEAAVRSINEPTKGKIEEMVNKIIKGRLNEGQLDNCDLTLKDMDKIRKAFLKGLSGIYHERIEYPKLSNKNSNKEENDKVILEELKSKNGEE